MKALPVRARGGRVVMTKVDDDVAQRFAGRYLFLRDGYAQFKVYVCRRDGKPRYRNQGLARWIMGLVKGDAREVDHINRDRLDNRRANLRVVTGAQNAQNLGARPSRPTTRRHSSARGVCWVEGARAWRARVAVGGKVHHLGYFRDEREAARAAATTRAALMPYSAEGSAYKSKRNASKQLAPAGGVDPFTAGVPGPALTASLNARGIAQPPGTPAAPRACAEQANASGQLARAGTPAQDQGG